eukprot:scaffold10794_cov66-Phaeocystis_antarctica.AAC.15
MHRGAQGGAEPAGLEDAERHGLTVHHHVAAQRLEADRDEKRADRRAWAAGVGRAGVWRGGRRGGLTRGRGWRWETQRGSARTRQDEADDPRADEADDQLLVDHERHRLTADDRRDRAAAVRVQREQHEPVDEADLRRGVEDGGAVARAVADEADPEEPGEVALEERRALDRAHHLRR